MSDCPPGFRVNFNIPPPVLDQEGYILAKFFSALCYKQIKTNSIRSIKITKGSKCSHCNWKGFDIYIAKQHTGKPQFINIQTCLSGPIFYEYLLAAFEIFANSEMINMDLLHMLLVLDPENRCLEWSNLHVHV